MKAVIYLLTRTLFKRKSLQITLILSITLIGLFLTLSYQNFLYLQSQNISQLSVYNEIIKPLSGLVLLSQLIIIGLVSSLIKPYFSSQGQQGLFLHSGLRDISLMSINFLVVFLFSLIPLAYFLVVCFALILNSEVDIWLVISTVAALIAASVLFGNYLLAITLHYKKTLVAWLVAMSSLLVLFILDDYIRNSQIDVSIYLDFFIHIREGLIDIKEIIVMFNWALIFFLLFLFSWLKNRLADKSVFRNALIVTVIILVSNMILLKNLNTSPWDISQSGINSLNNNLVESISKIDKPIKITAVIDEEKNQDEIRRAVDIISQYNKNIELNFTNRQALMSQSELIDQFVTVEIEGIQQSARYPFDRTAKEIISHLMVQLTTRSNQWITFIEGHGEASPFGSSGRDVTGFYQSLKDLGWPVAIQNLKKHSIISHNTKVVVIAAGKKKWFDGEVDALMNYLNSGGSLLVLREFDDELPAKLVNFLGIRKSQGVLIDWQGFQSGTPHPAILIVNQFEPHPINTGFDSLLAFPWSVGLFIDDEAKVLSKQYEPILQTHKGIWNEIEHSAEELSFDSDKGEQQKVFNLGFSIEDKSNQQRVIVLGDSSFLSDSAINNYANKQFSLNLISWLSAQKMTVSDSQHRDSYIQLSPFSHFIFNWLFSLILPLVLIVWIGLRWFKNSNFTNRTKIENERGSHE